MVQVTLKTYENNKEVSETVNIRPMNVFQIRSVSKEINALLKDIKANESLQSALNNYFDTAEENKKRNNETIRKAQEEGRDVLQEQIYTTRNTLEQVGGQFITDVMGSLEILLEDAPEMLTRVLAVASNVEHNLLNEQDPYTFLDIFDAVVEVNDLEKLVERLKKSSASLKAVANALFPKKEAEADDKKVAPALQK